MSSDNRRSKSNSITRLGLSFDNAISPADRKRMNVRETAFLEQMDNLEKEKVLIECELK